MTMTFVSGLRNDSGNTQTPGAKNAKKNVESACTKRRRNRKETPAGRRGYAEADGETAEAIRESLFFFRNLGDMSSPGFS